MMKRFLVTLAVSMTAAAGPAWAQAQDSHPGYYPVEAMGLLAADEMEVNVDLQGAMLQVAAAAMQEEGEDADLAQLVSKLERVRVQVGPPRPDQAEAIRAALDRAVGQLEGSGWKRILSVLEEDEQVYLFARELEGVIVGLTAMVSDGGGEVVLVNVVGSIDPVLLGRVIAKAGDLPGLERFAGTDK
jgi:hypothetical protein